MMAGLMSRLRAGAWKRKQAPPSTTFLVVAESGLLERQALLLCESLRLFGGAHARSSVLIVSPRADRRPSQAGLDAFRRLDCDVLALDVKSLAPAYGPTFRMHAAAAAEGAVATQTLVVLDSDILIAAEPDFALDGCAAAARPVDVKGMCSSGPDDPADSYWRQLADCSGVNLDSLPYLISTVDKARVRASHNAGVVAVEPAAGIFRSSLDYFEQSVRRNLRPSPGTDAVVHASHAMVRGAGAEYWGSAQACLSLAIWGRGLAARTLPVSHNFPLHSFYATSSADRRTPLSLIHYHRVFNDQMVNPLLNGDAVVSHAFVDWLKGRADEIS